MGHVTNHWYEHFASLMEIPLTSDTLAFFECWQGAEGGRAKHNPWNNTEPWPGDSYYNSFGPQGQYHVRNYPTMGAGVAATVKIFHQENFAPLLKALKAKKNPYKIADVLGQVPWGTSAPLVKDLLRKRGIKEPKH